LTERSTPVTSLPISSAADLAQAETDAAAAVVALQRAAERIGIKAIESVVAEMHERAAAAARNTSAEFAREEEALAAEAVHETAEAAAVAHNVRSREGRNRDQSNQT
jgi:hypothetical protein